MSPLFAYAAAAVDAANTLFAGRKARGTATVAATRPTAAVIAKTLGSTSTSNPVLKSTGFSPYIKDHRIRRALASEGMVARPIDHVRLGNR
jgi:hypothetical protein